MVQKHFNHVYVLHRHIDPKLQSLLAPLELNLVAAPVDSQDMGDNIAHGVKTIESDIANVNNISVFLGDMPFMESSTIKSLLCLLASDNIVRPTFKGQQGHPVCFGNEFFDSLKTLNNVDGAKSVIQANLNRLNLLEVDDIGVIKDIDTKPDWHQ